MDRSRGTGRYLAVGAALVFVGAALVACGVVTHRGSEWLGPLTLLGAAMLVFGLVTTIGGMASLLAQDEYLAVRADGILVHRSKGDVVLSWSATAGVRYDATQEALVFEAKNNPSYVLAERYSGASGEVLAAHLEELRRKAAIGPLDLAQVGRIALGLPHRRPS